VRPMMLREHLRNRCNFAGAKALATNYEIGELVKQSVVNIVICEGGHKRAPVEAYPCFGTAREKSPLIEVT
jgi:hypothetical protein